MVTAAAAIAIATTAPYVGYAAIGAAVHNIHKILLVLFIQSNIFVRKSIQLWLDISAIIALVFVYGIVVVDVADRCPDDGIGDIDVWGYDVGLGDADGDGDGCMMMITWDLNV